MKMNFSVSFFFVLCFVNCVYSETECESICKRSAEECKIAKPSAIQETLAESWRSIAKIFHIETDLGSCGGKAVVCYFTNWAWYRSGNAKFTPDDIDPTLCTHIVYAFASLDESTNHLVPYDSWADLDNGFYGQVTALRSEDRHVLIAAGGWNDSKDKWLKMMKTAETRKVFVDSVVEFIAKYNFTGLDMDLEYPQCIQGDRSQGTEEDGKNFNLLMAELKAEFEKQPGKPILTVAISAGEATIKECYSNVDQLCQTVDQVHLMAYDYHSYADKEVGANAPLCGTGESWGVYESVNYFVNTLKCPSNKLVLGIPFYAQTYTTEIVQNAADYKFGMAAGGAGIAGTYTQNAGTLAYYEVCAQIRNGTLVPGINCVNGSYAYGGGQFASYDSIVAIERKSCLIKSLDLGGAMMWTLDYDDFNGEWCGCGKWPLLKTLNNQVRGADLDVPCNRRT